MATTDWEAVENAIRAWVVTGSGLPADKVIWANQDGDRPEDPFITIALSGLHGRGMDTVESSTDLNRPAGEEIRLNVKGLREMTASVQAFTDATTGNSGARALLMKVQAALRLPSIRDALGALSLSPFDPGDVQVFPIVFPTGFEGRGTLAVRFYVMQTVDEFTGYISSVELTNTSTGDVIEVDSEE